MSYSGNVTVRVKNNSNEYRNAANEIVTYRDSAKSIIHKVNRKLDKTYFVNRLTFAESSSDKISIKAKITAGPNRLDDFTEDRDIRTIMEYVVEELKNHNIYNVKLEIV
jgi:hypothetical protein